MPPTLRREKKLVAQGHMSVIGVDEAGRGPLAGPVVAAAVESPKRFKIPSRALLDDSKKLTAEIREQLFAELTGAVRYGVSIVDTETIDRINIRQASWLAMQQAVADLVQRCHANGESDYQVAFVIIDGLPYGPGPWPYEAIIKGDGECLSIAAASIIAKVTRDRIMVEYDAVYPQYGFGSHKGYSCPQHFKTLQEHGPCPLHRRSFAPVRAALEPQTFPLFDSTMLMPSTEESEGSAILPIAPDES